MTDELSQRERALRRLPLPYSLALRLRDAGISADVICQYVNVELAALDGLYRIAEAKSPAAQKGSRLAATTSVADRSRPRRGGVRTSHRPIVPTADHARSGVVWLNIAAK